MSSLPKARDGDDDANTKKEKVEESHEDCFTVPDVSAATADNGGAVNDGNSNNNVNNRDQVQHQLGGVSSEWKRRRGRNPVDKENRRIKRLLRNRVSAQEARERKKVYVNELETRAKELQDESAKLEEMISTLINENAMLRKVLMNMRCTSSDGSNEPKDDQSSKC